MSRRRATRVAVLGAVALTLAGCADLPAGPVAPVPATDDGCNILCWLGQNFGIGGEPEASQPPPARPKPKHARHAVRPARAKLKPIAARPPRRAIAAAVPRPAPEAPRTRPSPPAPVRPAAVQPPADPWLPGSAPIQTTTDHFAPAGPQP